MLIYTLLYLPAFPLSRISDVRTEPVRTHASLDGHWVCHDIKLSLLLPLGMQTAPVE